MMIILKDGERLNIHVDNGQVFFSVDDDGYPIHEVVDTKDYKSKKLPVKKDDLTDLLGQAMIICDKYYTDYEESKAKEDKFYDFYDELRAAAIHLMKDCPDWDDAALMQAIKNSVSSSEFTKTMDTAAILTGELQALAAEKGRESKRIESGVLALIKLMGES